MAYKLLQYNDTEDEKIMFPFPLSGTEGHIRASNKVL